MGKGGERIEGEGSDDRGRNGIKLSFWKHAIGCAFEVVSCVVYYVIKLITDLYHNGLSLNVSSSALTCVSMGGNEDAAGNNNIACEDDIRLEKEEIADLSNVTAGGGMDADNCALEMFPKKVWSCIEKHVNDSKDWSSFIQSSKDLEKLFGSKKTERLFSEVLRNIFKHLETLDLLNLRVVSKSFKHAVDDQWLQPGLYPSTQPTVYLTDLQKVSRFTREMNNDVSISPIPFSIVAGVGSPTDPEYHDSSDDFMDKLTTQVFWKAFARCTEKLSPRIISTCLDIRVEPSFGIKFAEEIVSIVINECLKNLPHVKFLSIVTNTSNVEKALSSYYSVKGPDCSRFPSLPQLEFVDFITLGEGHPTRSKFKTRNITFPSRFLRQHGHTLKSLRVYSNLFDFKSIGILQAASLERVIYDIHHCVCQGKEAELKALLALPVVDQEEAKNLKEVIVKVNWQWRTSDISSFFKWLGRNYPGHEFNRISLRNSQNPLKVLDSNYHPQHSHDDWGRCQHSAVAAYGSDFPWITKLLMPPIKKLELITEYKGSWEFLKAIRGSLESLLMQKHEFTRNGDLKKCIFKRGLVRQIFEEEAIAEGFGENRKPGPVVWDFFPNLNEIVIIWRVINFKNFNWDMDVLMNSEEYKRNEIVRKMRWKVTKDDYLQWCRKQEG